MIALASWLEGVHFRGGWSKCSRGGMMAIKSTSQLFRTLHLTLIPAGPGSTALVPGCVSPHGLSLISMNTITLIEGDHK
ncbi:unnamed protein product [Nezara viridula]|uniref:Uncharacterized protein n=1 Tax=Nezara viridula TaxID=85310 RepID=A0A9P0HGX0_NEZVI|nr:unnamed protein product [Nezara viridula]